jgi:hypothetical protein
MIFSAVLATLTVGAAAPALASDTAEKTASLSIIYRADAAAQAVTWSLECPARTGTHPNPFGACDRLANLSGDPFTPVPKGTLCLDVYGGPQTASVTGSWGQTRVSASFRLNNSCEIARWQKLVPVLPTVNA